MVTPRHCVDCGLPDVLPNRDRCRHCAMGEIVITVGSELVVAFGIAFVAALVAWWMS